MSSWPVKAFTFNIKLSKRTNMHLFGFSLIRNGRKYDYPFAESFKSLGQITESITLALGASDDGTEQAIADLKLKFDIVPTVWDDNFRKEGLILSQQTNVALKALEQSKAAMTDAWGFYIQADEVLHEDDNELFLADLKRAQDEGYDSVSFRYMHFWLDYQHIGHNWFWYPQEIRAIKLNQGIQSYGDAQSFENCKKTLQSDARIFHYGHVREPSAYKKKVDEAHRWWHDDAGVKKAQDKWSDRAAETKTLLYLGPHPLVMADRMGGFGYPRVPEVNVVGEPKEFSAKIRSDIQADKVNWFASNAEVKNWAVPTVILKTSPLDRFLSKSKVPLKDKSKLGIPWTKDFWATLKFSEQKICVGRGPAHLKLNQINN